MDELKVLEIVERDSGDALAFELDGVEYRVSMATAIRFTIDLIRVGMLKRIDEQYQTQSTQ